MFEDFFTLTPGEFCTKLWWLGVGMACLILLAPTVFIVVSYLRRAVTYVRTFEILWKRNWRRRDEPR